MRRFLDLPSTSTCHTRNDVKRPKQALPRSLPARHANDGTVEADGEVVLLQLSLSPTTDPGSPHACAQERNAIILVADAALSF